MRGFAALFILAACLCSAAHAYNLLHSLGVEPNTPVHRLYTCSQSLGPAKCLSALSAYRAQNAARALQNGQPLELNLTADVESFPWQEYKNSSDEELNSELCDSAEKLLQYRPLKLTMLPGYTVELESKGNGTLSVDVLRDQEDASTGRMTKKLQKQFYNYVPYMLIPGLIMSAILPFMLPAMKMMVVGVGILNNMALSGAVFTLLRNNAFNDHYHKKVIYVNEGYRNEDKTHEYSKPDEELTGHEDIYYEGRPSEGYEVQEVPSNEDWINNYYGNEGMEHRRSQRVRQRVKPRLRNRKRT